MTDLVTHGEVLSILAISDEDGAGGCRWTSPVTPDWLIAYPWAVKCGTDVAFAYGKSIERNRHPQSLVDVFSQDNEVPLFERADLFLHASKGFKGHLVLSDGQGNLLPFDPRFRALFTRRRVIAAGPVTRKNHIGVCNASGEVIAVAMPLDWVVEDPKGRAS